jgi:DNA gyrase subunit B
VSREPAEYDASHIRVLEGLEAVRKRPGMYVGSTDERGLHQLVFEIAGRAVNEVVAGRASRVQVALMPDGGVRVSDDGPGVPFEADQDAGGPGLEAQLTRLACGVRLGSV